MIARHTRRARVHVVLHRGTINWTTLYLGWLCSAVFYHLPSLKSFGLDVRADVSVFIVTFTCTFVVGTGVHIRGGCGCA